MESDKPQILDRVIWAKSDLDLGIQSSAIPDWYKEAYKLFDEVVSDSRFPCIMGVSAQRKGTLLYGFSPSAETREGLCKLRQILISYLDHMRTLSPHDALMAALIIFFHPLKRALSWEEYQRLAWQAIQFLHDHDPSFWPAEVPSDPDDPRWAFCFAGVPLFINVSLPAYENRRSRNLGSGMTWVVNPRDAFDVIGANTPTGREIRAQIRCKVSGYDRIGPSPDLGFYGDPGSREWKQYILFDTNDPSTRREFPLQIHQP